MVESSSNYPKPQPLMQLESDRNATHSNTSTTSTTSMLAALKREFVQKPEDWKQKIQPHFQSNKNRASNSPHTTVWLEQNSSPSWNSSAAHLPKLGTHQHHDGLVGTSSRSKHFLHVRECVCVCLRCANKTYHQNEHRNVDFASTEILHPSPEHPKT